MDIADIKKLGSIDSAGFKSLMRQQATTVAVITTGGDGRAPGGLTATAGVFSDNSLKDERFDMVDWFESESGVALLKNAAASAACTVEHTVPVFSHTHTHCF